MQYRILGKTGLKVSEIGSEERSPFDLPVIQHMEKEGEQLA